MLPSLRQLRGLRLKPLAIFGQFPSRQLNSGAKPLYVQGQKDPENPRIREYFYYIDHHGMLFLDDSRMKNFTSCFKEKQFLNFFFKNIRPNTTPRYRREFPYISLCGIERNFIRCDDVPIVFTQIVESADQNDSKKFNLIIAYSDLVYPFKPETLYMRPESADEQEDQDTGNHGGRIYHEASERFGGYGLIRSMLAEEISHLFVLNDQRVPVAFRWNDQEHWLTNQLSQIVR